ncbi:MAG: PAS domain-containing protein [Actinomycetota bacterium]
MSNRDRQSSTGARGTGLRDLLVVATLCVAGFVVGAWLDIYDAIARWISRSIPLSTADLEATLVVTITGIGTLALIRRKEARRERGLRNTAEENYRTLVEQVPAITYSWDPNAPTGTQKPLFVSPQIEHILGYTPGEWMSSERFWIDQIHPDDREGVISASDSSDASGTPFVLEYRMLAKDGRVVWLHDESTVVVDQTGRPHRAQGVMYDITSRKETEDLLGQAERRFRTLVERIAAVTYIEDPATGQTLYISPQIEQLFGYTPEEWLADPELWSRHLHPDDRDWVLAANAADSGDGWSIDYRTVHRDGRTVWLHNDANLIRDEDGEPLYWQGVAFDITELKEAEERIRGAEERYRTLVEQLPVVVYIDAIDEQASALYISPQYEAVFGFTPQERLEDQGLWLRQLHPEDLDRVFEESERTNRTGEPFDMEYRWIRGDGVTIWVHDQARQVVGADGVPVWQGVLTDITEARTAQDALNRRDAILQAAGLAAERFLRTPSWEGCIDEVLAAVGMADGAGRAFVFRNDLLEDGRLAMTKTFEWSAPGVAPTIDEAHNAAYPYDDGYSDWEAMLPQGVVLQGLRHQLEPRQREWLEREGVYSSLAVPVFVGGRWWGFIGIDQCDEEREWQLAEVEALRVVASTLGAAIGRAHAADQLTETENRYQALIEQLPTATFMTAAEHPHDTLYMSPQIETILGYTPEEWSGALWQRCLHPEDAERVLAEDERTNATGDAYSMEYRLRALDGRWVWVRDEAQRVMDAAGTPIYWQGVRADITERKGAEQQLREAEERFRRLVEQLPAITYVDTYQPGHVGVWPTSYISPQAEAILGYSSDEWRGDPLLWATIVHPEDRERVDGANDHHYLSEEPLEVEFRVFHKDGGVRWIRDEAVIIRGEDGVARWSQGILQDITERKFAEHQLHEAEQRYRSLIESMPAITYIDTVDADMRTIYVSPQVLDITGFTPQEWTEDLGLWARQVREEDLEWLLPAIEGHNLEGAPYDVEYRFRHKDGHWIWMKDSATVLRNEDGTPAFSQGIVFDITERKVAEEHLREAEERYRAIVEHVQAVIYVDAADASMRTIYISPQVLDMTGYSPEEWMEDPELWLKVTYVDDREMIASAYANALAAEESWKADYRLVTRDGRTIWVHDEMTIIRDEAGAPLFLQGVIFDVTERKLAEQALRESEQRERDAAERLRALDEMKNTFLAAVSHELRSPLTSILGLSLTLERTREMPPEDRNDLLERLSANARKLDRLLKDLLDIDRLNRGIVEPQYRLTEVGALARRTIDSLDALADRAVQILTDPVTLEIDPAKVERIVENLVMNAVRHTASDRTIWLHVTAEPGGVSICVEDDGPGVAPSLRDAIFEPFRQGPTVSAHSPGTGIGLSLVARFAELHGGRAWVEDRPGGGASFKVFLPDHEGSSPSAQAEHMAAAAIGHGVAAAEGPSPEASAPRG